MLDLDRNRTEQVSVTLEIGLTVGLSDASSGRCMASLEPLTLDVDVEKRVACFLSGVSKDRCSSGGAEAWGSEGSTWVGASWVSLDLCF